MTDVAPIATICEPITEYCSKRSPQKHRLCGPSVQSSMIHRRLEFSTSVAGGGDIYELVRLRYSHRNITGIDIRSECVAEAKQLWPQVCFIQGDASQMEFEDGCFDLVFESTMFATLPDDVLSAGIAAEMVRVCKPGGYLLLRDWRTPKPRDANYKALTKARLRKLFAVGRDTRVVGIHKGALVPPVGRFLSARLPSVYFLVAALLPMLVGQVSYLLQKSEQNTST